MKPSLLFKLFLLISFSSLAQEKVYKPFEHPVIQKLEKKSEDVIGFENRQKKSWLIAAVVDINSKNIYWINYFGEVVNQLALSDSACEKILNKTLDPFDYHLGNIESALELTDAAIAKLRFPELHLIALPFR